jgi:hypothetical protein
MKAGSENDFRGCLKKKALTDDGGGQRPQVTEYSKIKEKFKLLMFLLNDSIHEKCFWKINTFGNTNPSTTELRDFRSVHVFDWRALLQKLLTKIDFIAFRFSRIAFPRES